MKKDVFLPEPPLPDERLFTLIAARITVDVKEKFEKAIRRRGFRSKSEFLRAAITAEISQSEQATEAA